eukprot:jgi/Ulvmu1/10492/UM064_0029.1
MSFPRLSFIALAASGGVQIALAGKCTEEKCAKNWNRCGGFLRSDNAERAERLDLRCCDPDFHCVSYSSHYAQCRPKKRITPRSWDGEVLTCEASSATQLPQVAHKDGACGPQIASCAGLYPCCSADGKCGCTMKHCGDGCKAGFGKCISWTPQLDSDAEHDSMIKDARPSPMPEPPSLPSVKETQPHTTEHENDTEAPDSSPGCTDAWIEAAVSENNRLRAQAGAGPLGCHQEATDVAFVWSQDMCNQSKLSHDGFAARCQELGWGWCAENVLYNFETNADAGVGSITQWFNSPPHKKNMLNSQYTKVGYGYVMCQDGRVYWTGMYGR